ncbi:phosphatase PAP2 family protein [Ascidiimonas aurantiaca]|uniref:phosphatase PAP2 family protein n=1 Tax=Ascidiimonas aurantiaca TaxID=1685432 RepID=UPI0030EDF863
MVREFLKSSINTIRSAFSGETLRNSPYVATILISLIVFIIGINLFVELTSDVKAELMGDFDKSVTDSFVALRSPELTRYFTFVTDVGDVNGYLVMLFITTALIYYTFKKWKYVFQVILVLFLATISNVILKRVFNRARPEIEHLVSVKTLSYPSGHAMSSMAFYGFLIYLVYKLKIPLIAKTLTIFVLSLLIISIGTSRIYLGVHFPSDILGGWIAGAIWVFFCILIFNLIEAFRQDPLT